MKRHWVITVLILFLGACSKRQPISSGPYQAVKCGLSDGMNVPNKFVFNKSNGYLYFFDLDTDTFKPLTSQEEKGRYFNSIAEVFSRFERVNWFSGKKLIITQIYYFDSQDKIIKKSINLRSLRMYTIYQDNEGKKLRAQQKCVWIDPKLS